MNKDEIKGVPSGRRALRNGRFKDILLLCALALILLIAVWIIFYGEDDQTSLTATTGSENEIKVSRLLQEIDGVGEASVMICETEEGVESVVVVCEGANDLQVIMNVREAVAAALGTEEKAVKIYLKKE